MKKTLILFAAFLFFGITAFGQKQGEEFTSWYNSMKSASKAADKEIYLLKMLNSKEANQPQISYLLSASLQMTATTFADEANFKKALEYTEKITDPEIKEGTIGYIEETLITLKRYQEAHTILDPKIINVKKDKEGNSLPEKIQMRTLLNYGELLMAEGNFLEASFYLYPALSIPEYAEKFKEEYLRALIKGNSKKVDKQLVESIYLMNGKRSSLFKTDVQSWFIKVNGNDIAYLTLDQKALQNEKTRLEAMLSEMAVDKPAPDFEILDMTGNKITLASLRGKTVILDFWATWCQPCVASFPGMQKAVNYFKNDPSVVFMFIHTMEKKGSNVKNQVQNLLKSKGYELDVYLDLKDPVTGKWDVAQKFNVRGIPAKFVINKEGIIKFSHSGYVSEDEAVDEIKLMIEKANSLNK